MRLDPCMLPGHNLTVCTYMYVRSTLEMVTEAMYVRILAAKGTYVRREVSALFASKRGQATNYRAGPTYCQSRHASRAAEHPSRE